MKLQRITTQYIEVEDRIRLTGQVGQGQTVVLWLAQRLLQRLVPHLCQWLEKQIPVKPQQLPLRAQVQQSFAQQKATAEIERQAPVRAEAVSRAWLVCSVDLKSGSNGVQLWFKGAKDDEVVSLGMQPKFLRQWLGILHDQYRVASWPMIVWPVWMEESRPARHPNQVMVLH